MAGKPLNEIGRMDMNAAVDGLRAQSENERLADVKKPSREEAEAAVRTLIA